MSIPIYIIDDEPTILNALKQLLVIEGYDVEVFDNAADALIKRLGILKKLKRYAGC